MLIHLQFIGVKRQIKNWIPISLINVDSKIASKALASRMIMVLNSIVKCDQTAYVKGRYIGESIQLISDILEYTAEHEEVGILFSADFEKQLTQSNIRLYLPFLNHWVRSTVYSMGKNFSIKYRKLCDEKWPFHWIL